MPIDMPPAPPPSAIEQPAEAPVVDMREAFARKAPPSDAERVQVRAFIEGKIEMVRRDPRLSAEEKAKAIADLEARR